jgi:hypothetical protein
MPINFMQYKHKDINTLSYGWKGGLFRALLHLPIKHFALEDWNVVLRAHCFKVVAKENEDAHRDRTTSTSSLFFNVDPAVSVTDALWKKRK